MDVVEYVFCPYQKQRYHQNKDQKRDAGKKCDKKIKGLYDLLDNCYDKYMQEDSNDDGLDEYILNIKEFDLEKDEVKILLNDWRLSV